MVEKNIIRRGRQPVGLTYDELFRSESILAYLITENKKNKYLQDIIEDSRETTMKYSPSLQDGVFVVEVQQGVRARDPATVGFTSSPPEDSMLTDQRALVHNPPERYKAYIHTSSIQQPV